MIRIFVRQIIQPVNITVADLLSAIDHNRMPADHIKSNQGTIVDFPSAANKLTDAIAVHIIASIL